MSLALMAEPVLMGLMSVMLAARANRIANIIVAVVYVPITAFNLIGQSWVVFYGLGAALELLLLACIVRLAWAWCQARSLVLPR